MFSKSKYIFVLLLVLGLEGCTIPRYTSVGGGFWINQPGSFPPSWENSGGGRELYYRKPGGWRVLVWGYVGAVLAKDDLAVFVGNTQPGNEDHSEGFFAVQDSGPLVEIWETVLAFEAEKEKANPAAFVNHYVMANWYLKPTNDGFQLRCLHMESTQPDKYISLTWVEVSTIMQRVRTEGKLQKDRSGKSYLQIQYTAEQSK